MIKKKAVAGGIVALAAVLGGGGIFAWTRRTADTETLADNQKYVYAYVTSIEGNELTYMEVDESVVEADPASSTEDTENTEKGGDGLGAPGGSDGSGAPGGSDTAGAPGDSTEASGDGSGAPGDGSGAPGDSTEASGDGSGRLAGCRRELPERMLTQRRQTDSRRKKMATCRAMQHRTEQEVTVEEHRAEMAA